MFTFYIDESESGKVGKNYIFFFGGFIIEDANLQNLYRDFCEIKSNYGLRISDPIKWCPGQREKLYKKQRAIKNLNAFRKDILNMLCSYKSSISCIVTVLKEKALTYALERGYRVQYYVNNGMDMLAKRYVFEIQDRLKREKKPINKERRHLLGKIVVDKRNGVATKLAEKYHNIWRKRASNDVLLWCLHETLYYCHAKHCLALQLADMIVGSTAHLIKRDDPKYFNLIRDIFRKKGNKVKGLGVVYFPLDMVFGPKAEKALNP